MLMMASRTTLSFRSRCRGNHHWGMWVIEWEYLSVCESMWDWSEWVTGGWWEHFSSLIVSLKDLPWSKFDTNLSTCEQPTTTAITKNRHLLQNRVKGLQGTGVYGYNQVPYIEVPSYYQFSPAIAIPYLGDPVYHFYSIYIYLLQNCWISFKKSVPGTYRNTETESHRWEYGIYRWVKFLVPVPPPWFSCCYKKFDWSQPGVLLLVFKYYYW